MTRAVSVYAKMVSITPSEAQKFIANQKQNRHVSVRRVATMADDMVHHRWVANGETIKLDGNGRLIDGQHRLLAAIKANFTLPTLLVSGLPDHAEESIDQGTRRTPGHVLQMLKPPVKSSIQVAAACKILWMIEKLGVVAQGSRLQPSRAQILAIFRKYRGVEDHVRWAWNVRQHIGQLPVSHIAAVRYLTMGINATKAQEFFGAIENGGGDKGSITHMLTSRLRGHRVRRRDAPLAWTIKAWNAHYLGLSRSKFKLATNESWPEIEGLGVLDK